jgi:hypothetical protein
MIHWPLTWVLSITLLISCSRIDKNPKYPESQKDFGRVGQEIEDQEQEVDIVFDTDEETEQGAESLPSEQTPEITEPLPEVPESEEAIVAIDPNQVVASFRYIGRINPKSLRILMENGSTVNPWNNSLISYLIPRSFGEGGVLFSSRQTIGDSDTGESQLFQDGFSDLADLGVMFGEESESGQQILNRVTLDSQCPAASVCINGMIWVPTKGRVRTFCYFDAENHQPAILPYSPAPNFPKEDLLSLDQRFWHLLIKEYQGKVNCSDLEDEVVVDRSEIYVRYIVREVQSPINYRVATKLKVQPDLAVTVLIEKAQIPASPNLLPFLDSRLRLQSETVFYIDSRTRSMPRVSKIVRKSLRAKGMNNWIGGLIRVYNKVSPVIGVKFQLDSEFCQDMLDRTFQTYCPAVYGSNFRK